MDLNSSSISEAGSPNLVYRWLRLKNTVALASFQLSNYENIFTPKEYILPSLSPLTPIWMSVSVRDPRIPPDEFFSFASQIGPIYNGYYTQAPGHPSYISAAVTYRSKDDTYRCFEELCSKGYNAAILMSAPITANQMQSAPVTANQMQSAPVTANQMQSAPGTGFPGY